MKGYAVFLRGVNVGGINIKMADLRKALGKLPFEDVSTLLASGNVVLKTSASAAKVKRLVEECLRTKFGYDAWVVVLTGSRVAELVEACPYPPDSDDQHAYVTLSSDHAVLDELFRLGSDLEGTQLTRLGPEALAWQAAVGQTLDTAFSKLSSKPKYKSTTTTRNLRTLMKVRDAAK